MTGEELKKLIQKSQKEIDAKIRLIDDLMSADISGNNYVKLQAAKKDLTAFRSKVSNEKEWREADYQEKKNGASYLLKSGGIGGYTPESYVKKVVEAIDYKNEKSPYKPIVEKYNQNVASESTKGNMPVLNETALGLKEKVPQSNTPVTRKANTALAGAGSGMNNSVAVDNRTVTGDTPPEGARTTIPNKGEYVYTGGKWRHKSGDGYDFSANATNEKLLNEKVKSGDYEVWDNKAGGYVKGAPVARTAESIKAGGEFRLGLNKKTPLVDNGEGSPDLAEQMPKVGLVPPAAKQIASKKAAGDGITPREQLPTTGITTGSTIKDALGKLGGGGDTPLAKQSELYDPESYLAVKAGKKGLDLGKFGGVTDYLPDVFKAAMGLAGANEKLPEFKTPQYFTDYENKLREQSTQGLTDAEYAQSMRSADRGYAYDVNNISNFAGGSRR